MTHGRAAAGGMQMANKGGVMVKVGKLKGFVPASQLDPSRFDTSAGENLMDQLVSLVGQSVSIKVPPPPRPADEAAFPPPAHRRCFLQQAR